MKRLIPCLLFFLLFSANACSKKNDAQPPKTVDLGEVESAQNQNTKRVKPAKHRPSPKEQKNDPVDEKRAQPQIDEPQNLPTPEIDDPTPTDHLPPDSNDGFDFSDDTNDTPKQAAPIRRPAPKPGLSIEKLINIRELREQTGYAGALSESELPGQTPDARYNALRLSTDNPKELGFAIQVWKPGNAASAAERFQNLFAQSFGGKKLHAVATDAFVASHHNMNELAFYESKKQATVLISCSEKICSQDQLKAIVQIVQRRL